MAAWSRKCVVATIDGFAQLAEIEKWRVVDGRREAYVHVVVQVGDVVSAWVPEAEIEPDDPARRPFPEPRMSYSDYLRLEMTRTGLTRAEIVARDEKETADGFERAREAAPEYDARTRRGGG